MNILCLNTAFSDGHIAFEFEGKQYHKTIDSNCKHSENLLVEVEKLFNEAKPENLTSSEFLKCFDSIAVVVGPGSFTGLRIAISTAKAFLATNESLKAIPINSLELIARESKKENKTPILNALSGFYFVSKFKNSCEIEKPKMVTKEELSSYSNFVSIEALYFPSEIISLSPLTLLSIAKEKANKGEFVSENDLLPLYIRPSQAEVNFGNKK